MWVWLAPLDDRNLQIDRPWQSSCFPWMHHALNSLTNQSVTWVSGMVKLSSSAIACLSASSSFIRVSITSLTSSCSSSNVSAVTDCTFSAFRKFFKKWYRVRASMISWCAILVPGLTKTSWVLKASFLMASCAISFHIESHDVTKMLANAFWFSHKEVRCALSSSDSRFSSILSDSSEVHSSSSVSLFWRPSLNLKAHNCISISNPSATFRHVVASLNLASLKTSRFSLGVKFKAAPISFRAIFLNVISGITSGDASDASRLAFLITLKIVYMIFLHVFFLLCSLDLPFPLKRSLVVRKLSRALHRLLLCHVPYLTILWCYILQRYFVLN